MATIINADTSNGLKLTSDTSGVVEIQSAGTKVAEINASGVLSANSGYGSVAPIYGVRAWVNFNGTGTVAIRGSGNVSSITDNGTGDYTINFTTAMPDINYAMNGTTKFPHIIGRRQATAFTTTQARINQYNVAEVLVDDDLIMLAFYR